MDHKSTRKVKWKWKPKPGTPICHHTREAYCAYKGYKSFWSLYKKTSNGDVIVMAMPVYNKDGSIKRYQRVYVELKDLQPYYNKFLEHLDFVINVKEED